MVVPSSATVPEKVGLLEGAFVPIEVATSLAKEASLLIAVANSPNVLRRVGAPPTKSLMAACTKAVVASCVVLVEDAAVGAVGVPVSAGDARGAFRSKAVWVALDTGLLASDVLSTFPRPTIPLLIPLTVPVNVGLAKGAFKSKAV